MVVFYDHTRELAEMQDRADQNAGLISYFGFWFLFWFHFHSQDLHQKRRSLEQLPRGSRGSEETGFGGNKKAAHSSVQCRQTALPWRQDPSGYS